MPAQKGVQALVSKFRLSPGNPMFLKSSSDLFSFTSSDKEYLEGYEIKVKSAAGVIKFTLLKGDQPPKYEISSFLGIILEHREDPSNTPMPPSSSRRHAVDNGKGEEAKSVTNDTVFARIQDYFGKQMHVGSYGSTFKPSKIEINETNVKKGQVYGIYLVSNTTSSV
ncbi:SEP domain-containing protein [Caenorhabditis elegans]|uniref:SEP domain-containing protein n=1 Tax=Caenorhabditis elegans TaxID=6239 RepID=Q9XVF3_CAEEL|nr:SEP domain-containing protein [Caenorhabditis elegans]CAB03796.2 SEP domain-containing protein [Caenorhabditis elegans]|eukprot:NP_507937.2 Uncharacterized protein CELE_B0250.8 [Caenorhabditis elegans]